MKQYLPNLWSILIIILVSVVYFLPQFQGKVVKQGDIIQHQGMSKEATDFREQTGEEALWTNSMFSGMPTYQISARNPNNLMRYVQDALGFFIARPAGYWIVGMMGFYILLLLLGAGNWLALLGALLFGFTTNNLCLFEAGHNSKLMAIMTSPPIIAGVLLVFKRKYLIGATVFGIALSLNLLNNHPQMTYYLAIALAILVFFELYQSIVSKEMLSFFKSIGLLVLMTAIAIGTSASKIWTTFEYTSATMRGEAILTDSLTGNSKSKGLDWDYAMQWSNGIGDVAATMMPKIVGGGSGEWLDGKSPLGKAVGQRQKFQAPTYWGDLMFTSGPAYFGIVAVFLFILGLFIIKDFRKWWLLTAVIVTVMISMGKNMEWFNRLLFDNLPLLNKFRAPSSILSITAIFIPILGILALKKVSEEDNKSQFIKPLYITGAILGGLMIVLLFMGRGLFSFEHIGDEQYDQIKDVLIETRKSLFSSTLIRSLLFTLATFGVLWMYLKEKISSSILIGLVAVLGLIDQVSISSGYLGYKDFVSKSAYKKSFDPRPVDLQILQDKQLDFRVYDATINTFNSASTSYFHKTIGGYSAVKMQRYQDIIERHISKGNQRVLNMLNTKYFIINGPDGNPTAQMNPAALGNSWFINRIVFVNDDNAEIDSLTTFDPSGDVIINKQFQEYVGNLNPSKNGSIDLISYSPNKLEYKSNTKGEQLAVFSEVYYGPNKGWQAYLDGQPVDHIRVDYLLRGLKVPDGAHTIIFEFKPKAYFAGEKVSLVSSLILLLLLGYVIYSQAVKIKNKENE